MLSIFPCGSPPQSRFQPAVCGAPSRLMFAMIRSVPYLYGRSHVVASEIRACPSNMSRANACNWLKCCKHAASASIPPAFSACAWPMQCFFRGAISFPSTSTTFFCHRRRKLDVRCQLFTRVPAFLEGLSNHSNKSTWPPFALPFVWEGTLAWKQSKYISPSLYHPRFHKVAIERRIDQTGSPFKRQKHITTLRSGVHQTGEVNDVPRSVKRIPS